MYIIGKAINTSKFELVYAIFKGKENAETYNKKHRLDTVIVDATFPFFLIEEFDENGNHYEYIPKKELEDRIQEVDKSIEARFVYFNLWRIDEDIYNKNFPNEPVLRGVDFHIHVTDTDINEIEANGFDSYWDEIITI